MPCERTPLYGTERSRIRSCRFHTSRRSSRRFIRTRTRKVRACRTVLHRPAAHSFSLTSECLLAPYRSTSAHVVVQAMRAGPTFKQGDGEHSFTSVSHIAPIQTAGHEQLKPSTVSEQMPPFLHGDKAHASTIVAHFAPLSPTRRRMGMHRGQYPHGYRRADKASSHSSMAPPSTLSSSHTTQTPCASVVAHAMRTHAAAMARRARTFVHVTYCETG